MTLSDDELLKFGARGASDSCLRPVKSLYGLKQAGRLWNHLRYRTLIEAEYTHSVTDTCVYYQIETEGTVVIGTYVNDLLAVATHGEILEEFGSVMCSLELNSLGPAENVFGMRIVYKDATGYSINQKQMLTEFLDNNRLEKNNAVSL